MSGIFKGDSIYKSGGGGGGGYKDGGALVDGDVIKVENNSISTYTNTSRTYLNYYFEVHEDEELNAVIELTNEYNATINVYILRNGIYIPLGNVGGNTVNAGSNYTVKITGNSFIIDVVTPENSIYMDYGGGLIEAVKIGGLYWTKENLNYFYNGNVGNNKDNDNPNAVYPNDDQATAELNKYNLLYNNKSPEVINNSLSNGWRVPTKDDFMNLINYVEETYEEALNGVGKRLCNYGVGTNDTGLSLVANGNFQPPNSYFVVGSSTCLLCSTEGDYDDYYYQFVTKPTSTSLTQIPYRFSSIRLCKDV